MDPENIIVLDDKNFHSVTAADGKLVMVDFWAAWCAPCRAIAPKLEKLAQEYPENLIIGKLNIDEHQALAVKFGIVSIPTIQLYKNGAVVDTLVGSRPYQDFKNVVDRHL